MEATRKPRPKQPLPPPLPPETRTVGQLVAEAIRLYGRRFWPSLALGLGPAAVTAAAYEVGFHPALGLVAAAWIPLASASLVGACLIASGGQPRETVVTGLIVGVIVALPWALLTTLGFIPGVLWLALVGLAVPASVVERLPARRALARGIALARFDLWHAVGAIAALSLVAYLTQVLLFVLLNSASDQATPVAGFLASLVMQPLVFLGLALLYHDQAARAPGRRSASARRGAAPPDASAQ